MDLFNGTGALSEEELAEVLRVYHLGSKGNFGVSLDLGEKGEVKPKLQALVNQYSQMLGNFIDRLILTLETQSLKDHAGDCSFYSSLDNGNPEDGICTCGYGLQQMRRGDNSHMYSEELGKRLCGGVVK